MKMSKSTGFLVAGGVLAATLLVSQQVTTAQPAATPALFKASLHQSDSAKQLAAGLAKATFAGGCFWSMQHAFEQVENMIASSTVGYIGGHTKNPTYEEVSAGDTGHVEAVQIVYDPKKISYDKLLDVFWHNVDPVNDHGQFCDNGTEYRSEIFYQDDEQKRMAEQAEKAVADSGKLEKPIVTKIVAAPEFYPAEDYHQNFSKTNPEHYANYRRGCQRDGRLKEIWGETGTPAITPDKA